MEDLDFEAAMAIQNPVLDVPPQLIAEVAVGLDSFEEICARYHYTPDQSRQLGKDPGFKARVSRMAQELKKDGVTFRMRAAHAAEDLVGDIWRVARRPDTSLALKIESLKTLSKLGGMEPTPNVQSAQGTGFSITINIPGAQPQTIAATPQPEPIDVTPVQTKNSVLALPDDWDGEE